MKIPIYQVDAFTRKPFAGNPAAVCLLQAPAEAGWMQDVAREMNLSETAFLAPEADGSYQLRWFTPEVEVALCGHATLASAHILWESGCLEESRTARFHTLSGLLTCRKDGDWIEMDFPARQEQPADPPPGLLEALGVEGIYTGRYGEDYLIEAASDAGLRSLKPDHAALNRLAQREPRVRAVIVTSRSASPEFDFVSRFFAPGSGIAEDPVTGSAHTILGPYWRSRLGKETFQAFQASERGGVLRLRLEGELVKLSGQAVTLLSGQLWV